jgi:hypothetical protein
MIETIQLQLLLGTFAGWVGRRQARVIAYLIVAISQEAPARVAGVT